MCTRLSFLTHANYEGQGTRLVHIINFCYWLTGCPIYSLSFYHHLCFALYCGRYIVRVLWLCDVQLCILEAISKATHNGGYRKTEFPSIHQEWVYRSIRPSNWVRWTIWTLQWQVVSDAQLDSISGLYNSVSCTLNKSARVVHWTSQHLSRIYNITLEPALYHEHQDDNGTEAILTLPSLA